MRRLIVIAAALAVAFSVASAAALANRVAAPGSSAAPNRAAVTLTGAGATFPFPLIAQWVPKYDSLTGVTVNYNPIGSGGGIAAIQNRTVDFGASDAPLTADQFDASRAAVQIPWALSATAVSTTCRASEQPAHERRVLADIYLGRITRWNSRGSGRSTRASNLPDMDIMPVRRSDGSGTTYNFTDFLSRSARVEVQVGRGTNVDWPQGIGGRGCSGVAGVVTRTQGAVGYVDIAYALGNRLQFFGDAEQVRAFALPGHPRDQVGRGSTEGAALNEMSSSTRRRAKYANAYPICTYTYVILPMRREGGRPEEVRPLGATDGQKLGPPLLFVPIPRVVLQASERTLAQVQQGG